MCSSENFEIHLMLIYKKILEITSSVDKPPVDFFKKGIMNINLGEQKCIKKLKIYNSENDFLHLRGVALWKNSLPILDDDIPKFSYTMGQLYNTEEKTEFKFNEIRSPYMFHTLRESENWIEIVFSEYIMIDRIVIYSRNDSISYRRSKSLCVDIHLDDGNHINVLNNIQTISSITQETIQSPDLKNLPLTSKQLEAITNVIVQSAYEIFGKLSEQLALCSNLGLDSIVIKHFINDNILRKHNVQFTTAYGCVRTFNLWSDKEKHSYISDSLQMIDMLYNFSPTIFYGFGTLLGFIREKDFFIPHDCDIDIIMLCSVRCYRTIDMWYDMLVPILKKNNIKILNTSKSAIHIKYKKSKKIDIFLALEDEIGNVAVYPGHRGKYLHSSYLCPTINMDIMGLSCPIPRNPFEYLKVTYGDNWRTPIDKNFHRQ